MRFAVHAVANHPESLWRTFELHDSSLSDIQLNKVPQVLIKVIVADNRIAVSIDNELRYYARPWVDFYRTLVTMFIQPDTIKQSAQHNEQPNPY